VCLRSPALNTWNIITFGIGIGTNFALFGLVLHARTMLPQSFEFLVYGRVQQRNTAVGKCSKSCDQTGHPGEPVTGASGKSIAFSGLILAWAALALVRLASRLTSHGEFIYLWGQPPVLKIKASYDGTVPHHLVNHRCVLFILSINCDLRRIGRALAHLLLGRRTISHPRVRLIQPIAPAPFLLLVGGILPFRLLDSDFASELSVHSAAKHQILIHGAPIQ